MMFPRGYVDSTLKRHGYYCRSRKSGPSTRPRSCVYCARGKVACDNKRPECSRCTTKGVECVYPVENPKAKLRVQATHTRLSKTATSPITEHPTNVRSLPEGSAADGGVAQSAHALSDHELPGSGGYIDWEDTGFGLADSFDAQSLGIALSPWSTVSTHHATTSTAQIQTYQPEGSPSCSNLSIPRPPALAVRSLIHRPATRSGTQRISKLILHNLKSYPLMIQHHNGLPPFIHKSIISSSAEDPDAEPLTNCLSLVHMIGSGVQTSRKLFWTNVRMECERLSAEVWPTTAF